MRRTQGTAAVRAAEGTATAAAAAGAAAEVSDVVFTYFTDAWADSTRRGFCRPSDQAVLSLMGSPRVGRLLVVDAMRSRPVRAVRRLRGVRPARFPTSDAHHLVAPMRVLRGEPTTPDRARRLAALTARQLSRAAAAHGLTAPAVITTNPFLAAHADLAFARSVTYYARDDWAAVPARSSHHRAYLDAYAAIARREVRVCAVSAAIIERIAPGGPTLVLPNGVDPDLWQRVEQEPPRLFALPRPRLAYAGTLDDRLDIDVVLDVARRRPDASVLLAGRLGFESPLAELRSLPNVHYLGFLAPTELAAVLQHVDACLMPHRRNRLTEAMSPLKLMDYLSAGAPAVVTDLPPVRGFGDRVVLAAEGADWVACVDRALAIGRSPEAERQAFVQAHSWRRRHDALLDLALR